MGRVQVFCLRVLMFFLVAALVTAIERALGVSPDLLPWIFVGAGLGAVLAVDIWIGWMARRHTHQDATPPDEDDRPR